MLMKQRITGFVGVASLDRARLKQHGERINSLVQGREDRIALVRGDCFLFYLFPSGPLAHEHFPISIDLGGYGSGADDPYPEQGVSLRFASLNSCSIVTDPVGMLNVYRCTIGEVLLLSTSSLLLATLIPELTFDRQGWLDFITTGYLTGHRTYYRNVEVVDGGMELRISPDVLPQGKEHKWWYLKEKKSSERIALENLKERSRVLVDTLARDYRPCCDLTGGFDSRGILAMFLDGRHIFESVVNGFPGTPDVVLAKRIAAAFDIPLRFNNTAEFDIPSRFDDLVRNLMLTDGEIDICEYYIPAAVHMITRSRNMATVNGTGGELFRGYWWEGQRGTRCGNRRINLDFLVQRILLPDLNFTVFASSRSDIKNQLTDQLCRIADTADCDRGALATIDWLYLRLRMSRWAARFFSSTIKILPCFSPFLFTPILEIAFSVPSFVKKRNRFYMKWLQLMNPQLAQLPLESGRPAVPLSLTTLPLFYGVPVKLAQKAIHRILPDLRQKDPGRRHPVECLADTVFDNWEVESFFAPEQMITGDIFDRNMLEWFSGMSRKQVVSALPPGQLSRMLTLETTMRYLEEMRKNLS